MSNPTDALQTQIRNIQAKTGKSLDELAAMASASGLEKHAQLRSMFQEQLGLGYGDANTLVHAIRDAGASGSQSAQNTSPDQVLDEIYSGAKSTLRPIHDELMARIETFGPFEIAPKKGYVSLRATRQFAMIGPATKSAIEIGINAKELADASGWKLMPKGSMCTYTIRISDSADVTDELVAAIRAAYDS